MLNIFSHFLDTDGPRIAGAAGTAVQGSFLDGPAAGRRIAVRDAQGGARAPQRHHRQVAE